MTAGNLNSETSVVIGEDQNNDKDDLDCYWYVNKADDDHIDDQDDDKSNVYDDDSDDNKIAEAEHKSLEGLCV